MTRGWPPTTPAAAIAGDLTDMIEAVLADHTSDHWLTLLEQHGIPAGPINTVAEALAHPQVGPPQHDCGSRRHTHGRQPPVKIHPYAADDDGQRAPAPKLDADRARLLAEFNQPA